MKNKHVQYTDVQMTWRRTIRHHIQSEWGHRQTHTARLTCYLCYFIRSRSINETTFSKKGLHGGPKTGQLSSSLKSQSKHCFRVCGPLCTHVVCKICTVWRVCA